MIILKNHRNVSATFPAFLGQNMGLAQKYLKTKKWNLILMTKKKENQKWAEIYDDIYAR